MLLHADRPTAAARGGTCCGWPRWDHHHLATQTHPRSTCSVGGVAAVSPRCAPHVARGMCCHRCSWGSMWPRCWAVQKRRFGLVDFESAVSHATFGIVRGEVLLVPHYVRFGRSTGCGGRLRRRWRRRRRRRRRRRLGCFLLRVILLCGDDADKAGLQQRLYVHPGVIPAARDQAQCHAR